MTNNEQFRVGDWVEVLGKEEILRTLDENARSEEIPFMPQMFEYCGRRFRVSKSAHKACDTVNSTGARWIDNAVHLEDLRCNGEGFDACQSGCLLYFKNCWLRSVEGPHSGPRPSLTSNHTGPVRCTEADVIRVTRSTTPGSSDVRFVCQATQLPYASSPLPMWSVGQYVKDYSSGNARLTEMIEPIAFNVFNSIANAGVGVGTPLRWFYDRIQRARGLTPYPWRPAAIPKGGRTPSTKLNLQPGDWVQVKKYEEILETLDEEYKNRGMAFNAELAYYCDRTFRVVKRIDRIMDEKNGRLMILKNDCIVLEGTDCIGRFTRPLFCPRGGYTYWREIWLRRVETPRPGQASQHKPC